MSNDIVNIEQSIIRDIPNIKDLLPSSVSVESFTRAAAIAIATTTDLNEADPTSIITSLSKCAADGLVPDGKEAALVVYNTKTKENGRDVWKKKAQYMPMIDGVLKRARMSGEIANIGAKVVYENDQFEYWIDEQGEHFRHVPNFNDRGEIKLFYSFANLKSGVLVFEVMIKTDVDKVRAASRSGQYGPWKDWYDRMGCKSVTHRLAKRLPNSSEMIQMIEMGEQMNWQRPAEEIKKEREINPIYPDDKFQANFPKWAKIIASGKKSTNEVIDTVQSNFELTDDQKNTIKELSE